MNILVQGINYSPELTGIGKYTAEMCEWLAAKGHEVTIISAMPYYPQWKIQKGYSRKFWHTEIINKVKVKRTPLYVPANVTGISRIIHEFSFAIATLPYWIGTLFKKYDVIISVCPPFHLGFQSLLFGKLKNTPVIYHIQDLQVDAARRLGLIKNEKALKLLETLEKFIIQRVDKVSSISEGMKNNILKKGINESKYISLPNWVDVDFIHPVSKDQSLKADMGFQPAAKIIMYSGNMGEKQGLEMILDAAEELLEETNLYFLMIGEGATKDVLLKSALHRKLTNVKFLPLQPYKKLSATLASGDLHLVLQKKAAADLVLPSKLMTLLAAGAASIITAEPGTSLYEMVFNNNLGYLIEPENTSQLVAIIRKLLKQDISEVQKNARKYAVNKLSIDQILTNFEIDLVKLTSKNG